MATDKQKSLAKKRVDEIGPAGKPYKERAKALIGNPALVDQDQFGICGMAACTHLMLAYDPLRFADLLQAVFNNEEFEGINLGMKGGVPASLLEHRLEQYARKMEANPLAVGKFDTAALQKKEDEYALKGKGVRSQDTKLDFLVARSLGKLLKKVEKPLYDGAKDLSKKFAPKMGIAPDDILKRGDLALTGEAVQFILREIVQVPSLVAHDQSKLTSWAVINTTIDNWFSANKGREPHIVAAVNVGVYQDKKHPVTGASIPVEGFDWLKGIKPPDGVFRNRLGKPDFDHWVLITGPVKQKVHGKWGAIYEIPVWSWGEHYTAVLKQNNTQQCVAYLICVALDPTNTHMPLIVTKSSPDWVADKTTTHCTQCNAEIGAGSRHHCRLCGNLFCSDCCPELDMVPGQQLAADAMHKVGKKFSPIKGPVRVCSKCFRQHAGFDWMRDSQASKCAVCGTSFGVLTWKHHCRYCGKVVCDSCSKGRKASPGMGYDTPVRICKTCVAAGKWK